MIKTTSIVGTALLVFVLIQCTGSPIMAPRAYPVESNKKYILPRFSVYPPEGSGWYYSIRFKDSVFFLSDSQNGNKSINIEILKLRNPIANKNDFIEYAKYAIRRNDGSEGFRLLKNTLEESDKFGGYCVRYRRKAEMHHINMEGKRIDLFIENEGYLFYFPEKSGICFDINLYESYKAGGKDPLFTAVFERFLTKVEIFK